MSSHNLPPFGPFRDRPRVDFLSALVVLILTTALAGMSLIALIAILGRFAS